MTRAHRAGSPLHCRDGKEARNDPTHDRSRIEPRRSPTSTMQFEPVSPDDADEVKVVFDDGEIRFGVKSAQDQLNSKLGWRRRGSGVAEGLIERA